MSIGGKEVWETQGISKGFLYQQELKSQSIFAINKVSTAFTMKITDLSMLAKLVGKTTNVFLRD
ncbi:hypothetical protein MTBLM1_30018 [Rhodospirillaceae bacterium LM-1]|nr:hypothetical protein MTBLM1_30018 [Rhodospirillaceae bacterium LM-1]